MKNCNCLRKSIIDKENMDALLSTVNFSIGNFQLPLFALVDTIPLLLAYL